MVPGKGLVKKDEMKKDDEEDALPYYEVFGSQRSVVREWMAAMGSPVIRLKGREADDIIYQLTSADEGQHLCVIMSDDKDFLQLLSPSVHVYRAIAEEYYDPEKFKKTWKFPSKKYLIYKALTGDTSDLVPGIPGIGPVAALEIVNAVSSAKEVRSYCKSHKYKKFKEAATDESMEVFQRNLKLFDMRKEEFENAELRKIRKALTRDPPKIDWGTLKRIASELEFNSLASNVNQWMRSFK